MSIEKIAAMIKEARLAKGMTQAQVAKLVGFQSAQFVYMIENNISKVPLDVLGKLIHLLGLDESLIMNILISDFAKSTAQEVSRGKSQVKKRKSS
ncbi:MAG: helix-turn-helix domain-containing protein [Bdellovibrio sp.]|jgi:transcriptional regulator with XRE-family HTH domain